MANRGKIPIADAGRDCTTGIAYALQLAGYEVSVALHSAQAAEHFLPSFPAAAILSVGRVDGLPRCYPNPSNNLAPKVPVITKVPRAVDDKLR